MQVRLHSLLLVHLPSTGGQREVVRLSLVIQHGVLQGLDHELLQLHSKMHRRN
jgi:hypothetical protein